MSVAGLKLSLVGMLTMTETFFLENGYTEGEEEEEEEEERVVFLLG